MEAAKVISMRDTLKNGQNFPLIVYINNMYRLIDESATLTFTKWDDTNHVLYVISLADPNITSTPSNFNAELSIFSVDYEVIEAMEIARLPRKYLKSCLDKISENGTAIKDEVKQAVIDMFDGACDPTRVNLGPTDMNRIMGVRDGRTAVNDKDDYYEGKFTENYAETRRTADYNKYVDEQNKNTDGN